MWNVTIGQSRSCPPLLITAHSVFLKPKEELPYSLTTSDRTFHHLSQGATPWQTANFPLHFPIIGIHFPSAAFANAALDAIQFLLTNNFEYLISLHILYSFKISFYLLYFHFVFWFFRVKLPSRFAPAWNCARAKMRKLNWKYLVIGVRLPFAEGLACPWFVTITSLFLPPLSFLVHPSTLYNCAVRAYQSQNLCFWMFSFRSSFSFSPLSPLASWQPAVNQPTVIQRIRIIKKV